MGRTEPEGYAYARNSPVAVTDPTGSSSDTECSGLQQMRILIASARAEIEIDKCINGLCGEAAGKVLRQNWINALRSTVFRCPKPGYDSNEFYLNDDDGTGLFVKNPHPENKQPDRFGYALTFPEMAPPVTNLPPGSFGDLSPLATTGNASCLAQQLAHEALHSAAYRSLSPASGMLGLMGWPLPKSISLFGWTSSASNIRSYLSEGWTIYLETGLYDAHEIWVKQLSSDCVTCGK